MIDLDTNVATVRAAGMASKAAHLAVHLANADGDKTGVWADAARRDVEEITKVIAEIKAEIAKLPSPKARAA